MGSTRIFICHDLDLAEETQEVQILQLLCQKLQERHTDVALYPGRASDEGFLAFFYQQLATCQRFLLFQTESAVHSSAVHTAVSVAMTLVKQERMQEILRFIALPEEVADLPPAWSALQTFGATQDYPRALEKLFLSISTGQEADTLSFPPVADVGTEPLPELPVHGYHQETLPASLPADRPVKLPLHLSKGQLWLSAALASALLLGVLLFSVVLPLHASSVLHIFSSPTLPAAWPTANHTATAGVQTSATASARASATASARGTVSAQATALASTPQGLYVLTTRKAPDVVDSLRGPSRLQWDVFTYSGGGDCGYGAGSYHAAMPQSGFFASCLAEAASYGNFLYQVRMTITGGSGGDGGGLIFRSAGKAAYRLHIGLDGSYDLAAPGGTLAAGKSAAIKTGQNQTNRVAVAARGHRIDIYVNGQWIIAATDTTSAAGKIGLLGVDFSSAAVKVVYSNAQIWLLSSM